MIGLLCRVFGHQRTLVAFTSNRFSCRRCGVDLGRDIPAMPSPPVASRPQAMQSSSHPSSGFPQDRSRRMRLESRGRGRHQARPWRGGA
jgi:hypothetical protein